MNDERKKIEIIPGDGTDLEISPVYDNLDIQKPEEDTNTKKNIVIPNANE